MSLVGVAVVVRFVPSMLGGRLDRYVFLPAEIAILWRLSCSFVVG